MYIVYYCNHIILYKCCVNMMHICDGGGKEINKINNNKLFNMFIVKKNI